MKFFSKITARKIFVGMALALSPLIANAENIVKLLMKDEITVVKQDKNTDSKINNQIKRIAKFFHKVQL